MRSIYFVLIGCALLSLTSCIEILDDITLNNDGSGTIKYAINLSASKSKISAILKLDSLDGRPVPSIEDLEVRIQTIKKRLTSKTGITNVMVESNYDNFIFKLRFDFASVAALQSAMKEVVLEESKEQNRQALDADWLSWDGTKLTRSIPDITIDRTKTLKSEDAELLKQGTYTSITRFERAVDRCENPNASISKNRLAVMIKVNPYSLSQNYDLIENTIYLTPLK
ncbi:MAG: hypothetical protein ACK45H_13185 [Bacteroidota bacterium]|jgi:hypothetical protein